MLAIWQGEGGCGKQVGRTEISDWRLEIGEGVQSPISNNLLGKIMMNLFAYWQQLVRFGFRLLYNELAWTYDGVSWLVSLGAWRAWREAVLPFVQGGRVLEIGHGPGHLLLALAQRGHAAVGLDLSSFMGRQAGRRLQQAGGVVPLVQGRVQRLPFAAGSFETVVATFPTDYVLAWETLTAVHRTLTPNGIFVIVPEGHLTGSSWLHRAIGWLFWATGQQSAAVEPDWEVLRGVLTAVGFTVTIHTISLPGSVVTVVVAGKR